MPPKFEAWLSGLSVGPIYGKTTFMVAIVQHENRNRNNKLQLVRTLGTPGSRFYNGVQGSRLHAEFAAPQFRVHDPALLEREAK